MDPLVAALSDLTSSDTWPATWLTLPRISRLLNVEGFWTRPEFACWSEEGRRGWLACALATEEEVGMGRPIWWKVGPEYKHDALLDLSDAALLRSWCHERRVVAGEPSSGFRRQGGPGPAPCFSPLAPSPDEILRAASVMAEELIR